MVLAKEGCKSARQIAFTCVILIFLTSCAHRLARGRAASAVSAGPSITKAAPQRLKVAATTQAPEESKPTLRSIVPKRAPTRAEQIIQLVREGYLTDEPKGALVFSKAGMTRDPASALYEDAILLGRLRRALKEAKGIPDSVSATATIRDAKAVLNIDETLPAPTAARAIDAALRTQGINAVQARIAG
jgi:hypothetical protein